MLLVHSGRCLCIPGTAHAYWALLVRAARRLCTSRSSAWRRFCVSPAACACRPCHPLPTCVTRRLHAVPGSAGLCHRHRGCPRSRVTSGDGFRPPALPCSRVWWRGRCLVPRGGLITLQKVIKTAGLQLGGSAAILGLPPSPRLGGTRAKPGPWRPNRAQSPASAPPPEQAQPWRLRWRLRSPHRGGSKVRILIGRLRSAPSSLANPRTPFASNLYPPPWSRPRAAAAGPGQSAQTAGNSKPSPALAPRAANGKRCTLRAANQGRSEVIKGGGCAEGRAEGGGAARQFAGSRRPQAAVYGIRITSLPPSL